MKAISVTLGVSDFVMDDPVEQDRILTQVQGHIAWFLQDWGEDRDYILRSVAGDPIGQLLIRGSDDYSAEELE